MRRPAASQRNQKRQKTIVKPADFPVTLEGIWLQSERIWSGGIGSQSQKMNYAQGLQHAAIRSQHASESRGGESERGESGDASSETSPAIE